MYYDFLIMLYSEINIGLYLIRLYRNDLIYL